MDYSGFPPMLYKFRGINRKDFFSNLKLRLSPINDLNDPFEGMAYIKHICPRDYFIKNYEQIINKITRQKGVKMFGKNRLLEESRKDPDKVYNLLENSIDKDKLTEIMYEIIKEDKIGILSLSETKNNELMWSMYADNHSGFAIGLKSERQFFQSNYWNDSKLNVQLRAVQYSKIRKHFFIEGDKKQSLEVLLHKSIAWEHEKEWRLIVSDITDKNNGLVGIPIDTIGEIILGYNVDGNVKREASEFCKKYNISIIQAKLSQDTYDIIC